MKYLTVDTVNQIRKNSEYYFKFFSNSDYEIKLNQEFTSEYYSKNDIEYVHIDFLMNETQKANKKKTDFSNSIKLFETYDFLTESQASDERFWAGLAIEKNNLNYLFYRWEKTSNTIKYRVVYHASGKRGYMYHGLARLWWFTYLTRLEGTENPYELTEFTFSHPHIMEKMIYRNFSNSKHIRLSVIKSIKTFVDNGGEYATKKVDELYKYVSLIGGNRLLDVMPASVLENELTAFLFSL